MKQAFEEELDLRRRKCTGSKGRGACEELSSWEAAGAGWRARQRGNGPRRSKFLEVDGLDFCCMRAGAGNARRCEQSVRLDAGYIHHPNVVGATVAEPGLPKLADCDSS